MRRGIPKHLGDEIEHDRFIQAPFDSTYDHRLIYTCKSDSLSYISPANPNPSTTTAACGSHVAGCDPRLRRNPSCTRVSNPILRPTLPSTFSLPLLIARYHGHTEARATNLLLAVRACLLPLSLPLLASKSSRPHKALLFFSPCFLYEMV